MDEESEVGSCAFVLSIDRDRGWWTQLLRAVYCRYGVAIRTDGKAAPGAKDTQAVAQKTEQFRL